MLRTLLSLLCIGWLIGVGWGSALSPLPATSLALVGLCGIAAVGLSQAPVSRALGIFLLTLLLGATWADVAAQRDAARARIWRELIAAPVTIEATVTSREVRGASLSVRLRDVVLPARDVRALPGLVQATLPADPRIHERARLRLTGRVRIPEPHSSSFLSFPPSIGVEGKLQRESMPEHCPRALSGTRSLVPTCAGATGPRLRGDDNNVPRGSFDLERYFARHGVVATMRTPRVQVLEEGRPSARTRLREWLHRNIQHALSEPSAGLLSAILLSYDHDLSQELRETFAATGIAHLIAISGSHIAIFAAAVFFGFASLGLSRTVAAAVTLLLTFTFLALVEFPASGVRSLIMVVFVYWAYAAGRRVSGTRALFLAAALMTAANPRLLLGDVGFQLSVLAMWGLLALYPVLALPFRHTRDIFHIRTVVLLTLAAEIATAPLVAYTFGRISLVGLATNILAIPLFPLLLVAGALVSTVGTVVFLQPLVAPPAYGVATLFIRLGELAATLPGAQLSIEKFSPAILVALYGIVFLVPVLSSPHLRRLRLLHPR